MGEAALGAKNWEAATAALTTCVQLDPSELQSHYFLIQAKIEQKQYKEAEEKPEIEQLIL